MKIDVRCEICDVSKCPQFLVSYFIPFHSGPRIRLRRNSGRSLVATVADPN
jgi:hypothetical protein